MDKRLITEIKAILYRYRVRDFQDFRKITLEDFEERIDWNWVTKNYHVSHAFIYEYQDKLDMQYLFDNYVITKEDLERVRETEEVDNRFEILDL
jgi:hypothetical protein